MRRSFIISPFTPFKRFVKNAGNGVHLLKFASSRNRRRWVPTFVGMTGLVLVSCSPTSLNNEASEIEEPKVMASMDAGPSAVKRPEYKILGHVLPRDIGLSVGMNPSEAKKSLREQGFQYIDLIGGEVVYGECAGASEVLTYYKRERIEDKKIVVLFNTDFRSELTDGECKRVLYSISPISIKEEI